MYNFSISPWGKLKTEMNINSHASFVPSIILACIIELIINSRSRPWGNGRAWFYFACPTGFPFFCDIFFLIQNEEGGGGAHPQGLSPRSATDSASTAWTNRLFPSYLVSLFQNESSSKIFNTKINLIYMKMILLAKHIFLWVVSHIDSFSERG